VIDGPFTETKELIAGFWLWQVKSKEEAIAWLSALPSTGNRGRDSPGFRDGGFRSQRPHRRDQKEEQKLREAAGGQHR